ncbi:uncharacterized protein PFL1_00109 [Pseudozyma flocculosa PF-1]|uniref:Solute carrier family 40 member n=1 Tax=Pseudozyma flocculosa TaxID=84751 RepID=A0A5C3ESF7_9BASI|nr:uncharacterized protein PFL1_00109 [Pseudozyma flocculosa PF-1]EPQ31910.1 hypothetical protein PFL1_00109 [Pseudozyma flocculosa PF-1]SPO35178.1 related to ferroportin 1 [Pseudozyma flocculosa]
MSTSTATATATVVATAPGAVPSDRPNEAIELQPLPSIQSSHRPHRDSVNYTGPATGSEVDADADADDDDGGDRSGAAPASGGRDIDLRGMTLLAVQHASSSWGYRSAEFAYPLYMVRLFTNTLLPASVYGFITTGAAIIFSNAVGRSIDRYSHTKLRTLRAYILGQKVLVGASYGLFLLLFLDTGLSTAAENGGKGPDGRGPGNAAPWTVFAAITLLGCGVILSNVGVSVAVEREWVQIISRGSAARLTRLNAIMRRIDLLTKLLAPLFVSLLTTTISYRYSVVVLVAICGLSAAFELVFVGIVYKRFPALADDEAKVVKRRIELGKAAASGEEAAGQAPSASASAAAAASPATLLRRLHPASLVVAVRDSFTEQYRDWATFVQMPVFITSVCISLLYMSVLSFDPTFIAYLKSETDYSDAFVAGMRAVGVASGLLGTVVMPWMEKRIGLVRTGSYSLWQETLSLVPGVVALFITGAKRPFSSGSAGSSSGTAVDDGWRRYRPQWNTAILFSSLSISRIGLWSFDLAQLALLQTALSSDQVPPSVAERKNALMALQFSLQNVFDLGHYGLTLGWNRPDQFKYAAATSLGAVGAATLLYTVGYARRIRGHLVHFDRHGLERLLRKKGQ